MGANIAAGMFVLAGLLVFVHQLALAGRMADNKGEA